MSFMWRSTPLYPIKEGYIMICLTMSRLETIS